MDSGVVVLAEGDGVVLAVSADNVKVRYDSGEIKMCIRDRDQPWRDFVSVCTDDVHAKDLLTVGHINNVVRKAVASGPVSYTHLLLGAHIAGVAVLLQFGAGRAVEDEGETDLHGCDLREMLSLIHI